MCSAGGPGGQEGTGARIARSCSLGHKSVATPLHVSGKQYSHSVCIVISTASNAALSVVVLRVAY